MADQSQQKKKLSPVPFAIAVGIFIVVVGMVVFRATEAPKPTVPAGLDKSAYVIPEDNIMTKEKINLGRMLYFDPRLSPDDTVSCATCHNPKLAFTDGRRVSVGIDGQEGGRNAPTVINRVFGKTQFWDGRAPDLEEQAKGPLLNPIEHGFGGKKEVEQKVMSITGYRMQFKKVFAGPATLHNIAKAIAAFERTVMSGNSRFDRYKAGEKKALSDQEKKGMELFFGKANCAACHDGPNFTDEGFHNLGVGMNAEKPDLGRFEVTKNEDDKGAFKTPTLREVTKTGPYMHDGSVKTLKEVMELYNRGGEPNKWLSPIIQPLGLSDKEIDALVAFMGALEGEGWQKVSAPIDFPN